MKVYGIKACDTCRKARRWLDEQGRGYQWHDLREDGLDEETLQRWLATIGPDTLVNRRSTTWRGLSESEREQAMNPKKSIPILLTSPTLIKRPIFETAAEILVGFNADVRDKL
ncbi:MAG: Spx/MgsR family RNA polymerase-binding regulatory protein [Wenzhouxiangellaceae bacterium]|nr:MAG: Spx/MgsR family RNA polymerase-binding regulatory protein [Wenzhouxiangellaceae bacterium]